MMVPLPSAIVYHSPMRSALSPWLARFSTSFIILGGFLLWESYKAVHGQLGPISNGRIVLFLIGATVSFVLAVVGIRERHRPGEPPLE
jgi:hypothetical protein